MAEGAERTGDRQKIQALLEFAREAELTEVEWEQDGRRIAFKRVPAPVAPAAASPSVIVDPGPVVTQVPAPMVGTFWRGSAKDRPPLVMEGDAVSAGQKIAIVEAMQLAKDVISPASGRLVKILVESGRPVEYGQTLFEIEPDASGS